MKPVERRSTIVLVDDDERFAQGFKSKIGLWDPEYHILTNKTFGAVTENLVDSFSAEVRALIADHREDCAAVFLDLGLNPKAAEPGISGYQLGKQLRDEFYEIPILILTQYGQKTVLQEGYFYDFDAYIEKAEFANWESTDFFGYLFRTARKREAMVRNLPRYFEKHVKRVNIEQPVTVMHAFGDLFVSSGNNLERSLDSAIAMQTYLNAQSRYTVVLFADLVGSSDIKANSGFFEGLRATREHNQIVTDVVKKTGGTVIKYIGDCVMSRYDYDEPGKLDCKAINAAIVIQEQLELRNRQQTPARPIWSKIGMAGGKVADFYGNDPQGQSVDLAARIQSKAQPQQILVSKELLDLAKVSELSSKIGTAKGFRPQDYMKVRATFKPKGFSAEVEIYDIDWDDGHRTIDD